MNTPNIFDRLSRKIHHHSDMEPHESDSGPPFDEVEPLNFHDEESVVHIFLRLKLSFHGSETLCNKFSVQLVQIDLPALFGIILLLCDFVDRGGKQINLIEIFPHANVHKRLL